MLIHKNSIDIKTFISHVIIILLYLCLNQNICLAATTQNNKISEENKSANNTINDPYLRATTWSHQKTYISDLNAQANESKKRIPEILQKLNAQLMPIYGEVQDLHLLYSLYDNKPRIVAIVKSRFKAAQNALVKALKPTITAKELTAPLLNKAVQIEGIIARSTHKNLETDANISSSLKSIKKIKASLTYGLEELNDGLSLSAALANDITTTLKKIDNQLPQLWYAYYLAPPINYLQKSTWDVLPLAISNALQQYYLRLPMEFPQSFKKWSEYSKYFLIMLFFGGLLGFYCNHSFKKYNITSYFSNIFKTNVPLIYIGIALITAAAIVENNYYGSGIFLMGNLIIIIGQVLLAWDLRHPDKDKSAASPLLTILPLTIVGYILIYLGIPPMLLTLIWIAAICILFVYRYFKPTSGDLAPVEKYILYAESLTLWISLILAILGLIQLSIIVYLFVIGLCIAIQMSTGCMQHVHSISNSLPEETSKAIVNSLIIAMAAPLAISLVFAGFALWIIALPGGVILIKHYSVLSFSLGDTQFNIIKILLFISTFYLARAIISIGSSFLHKRNVKGLNIDESIIPPLRTALTYTVWGGYFLFVLYSLGVSWKSLAVVAGGLSVGVGFGLQSIVNNFLSGLILIFSRSLQEKDIIEVGGHTGVVQKINIRATTIETFDNAMIYIPNSQFISSILVNWTRNSRSRRCIISVGVDYSSNVELVTKLLLDAAKEAEVVLKYPVPTVRFDDFGNSTLNFTLLFWVTDYMISEKTKSALRTKINKLFNENNINIAFPQLDLHIKHAPNSDNTENIPSEFSKNMHNINSIIDTDKEPENIKSASKITNKK